jgi:hypothetical protein
VKKSDKKIITSIPTSLSHLFTDNPKLNKIDEEMVCFRNKIAFICSKYDIPLISVLLQFPYIFGEGKVISVVTSVSSLKEINDIKRFFDYPVPSAMWTELQLEGLINPDLKLFGIQNDWVDRSRNRDIVNNGVEV